MISSVALGFTYTDKILRFCVPCSNAWCVELVEDVTQVVRFAFRSVCFTAAHPGRSWRMPMPMPKLVRSSGGAPVSTKAPDQQGGA